MDAMMIPEYKANGSAENKTAIYALKKGVWIIPCNADMADIKARIMIRILIPYR